MTAASLWFSVTFLWVGSLLYERDTIGTTSCPLAPGSSTFGEATWGWLPPGTTCTWTFSESVGDVVGLKRTPPPARTLTAIVLLLWGVSLLILGPGLRAVTGGAVGDEPPVDGARQAGEARSDSTSPD